MAEKRRVSSLMNWRFDTNPFALQMRHLDVARVGSSTHNVGAAGGGRMGRNSRTCEGVNEEVDGEAEKVPPAGNPGTGWPRWTPNSPQTDPLECTTRAPWPKERYEKAYP